MSHFQRNALVSIAAASVIAALLLPPIAQDPRYHAFADQRTIFGIPNFWNVISNVPFLLAAAWGVRILRSHSRLVDDWERIAFGVLVAGIAMVGIGSTWYHLRPCDSRLVWDRLPMTIVFMSALALTLGERASAAAGKRLLFPLVAIGLGSVVYWQVSGDLRFYAVVQFGSLLSVVAILVLFPTRQNSGLWDCIILYSLAKLLEMFDRQMLCLTSCGGHPWKHIAAACAVLVYESRGVAAPSVR